MKNLNLDRKYFDNKKRDIVFICIGTILYLIIFFFLIKIAQLKMNMNKSTLEASTLRSILIDFQMLLSIYLIIRNSKLGYKIALFLNGCGFFLDLFYTIIDKNIYFVPSMFSYLGVMFIIHIIYRYKININEQMNKIKDQKERIMVSEERYQKKNAQLLNHNKTMKEKEKILKQIAFFDDLTGSLNRKTFVEELNIQIEFMNNTSKKLHVVFIDIDNFKNINDSMGHHAGDYVLKELSKRIKDNMNEEDVIGRLGGDEIGMLIIKDTETNEVSKYINRIRKEVMKPFLMDNQEFHVTASFGISAFPKDGVDSVELLKKADAAMYSSKEKGKNQITFYDTKLNIT